MVTIGATLGVTAAHANLPSNTTAAASNVITSNTGVFTALHGGDAPSFSLVDLANQKLSISLGQFRGEPLVLNFWASWCPPCRQEMPALAQVASELIGKVHFLGLDTQDERSAGLTFARSTRVHYPLAFDTSQVSASYGVYGLPTTFFISSGGRLVGRQVGALTKSRLLYLINYVFATPPSKVKTGSSTS
jgi:cytochrome c biogenesis protein CcmG/thiol:disulfide interchange protein DsbE